MSAEADIDDFAERMLARLAERDLSAAEKVHDQLMAAETAAETAELARAYQRLARSVRQSLALRARFQRDRAQAAAAPQATESKPQKPGGAAIARRIRELREGALRVIWDEAEDAETADYHTEELDSLIMQEMFSDHFGVEPLDDHVARICLMMGFNAARVSRWRELPEPPPEALENGPPGEAPYPPDSG
jgi:hypothetical protein